jgi:hypothetical protein
VLPLKAGGRGDTVRVLDPAAHNVRFAKVEAENLLASTMDGGK